MEERACLNADHGFPVRRFPHAMRFGFQSLTNAFPLSVATQFDFRASLRQSSDCHFVLMNLLHNHLAASHLPNHAGFLDGRRHVHAVYRPTVASLWGKNGG